MRTYSFVDSPIKVYGIPFFDERRILERIPNDIRKKVPTLEFLGKRCPGARVCFRTNSSKITFKMSFETLSVDRGMSIRAAQSANVIIGDRSHARFSEFIMPQNYEEKIVEKTITKSFSMEDVTVWLPRNEILSEFTISVEDDSMMEAPTPYKYPPILYYGSSITEGGCCGRVFHSYEAIISQHLDVDFYNLGFSGSAKGEIEIADYIKNIPMSIFVLDYYHNAPDVKHLKDTHEPFFRRIRESNPDLPIIMMSKPNFEYHDDSNDRREVIRDTYNKAVSMGDKNVYFIDGESLFGDVDRFFCTNDGCHPNDLGFYRMALVIEPLVKKILEEKYGK